MNYAKKTHKKTPKETGSSVSVTTTMVAAESTDYNSFHSEDSWPPSFNHPWNHPDGAGGVSIGNKDKSKD